MNLYKSFIPVMAAVALCSGFVSCDDDFDRPPVIVPEATYEANTAISEFKEMFWQYAQGSSYATVPVNAEGDSIIIGGRIITSDAQGNIYQQVIVEDESGALYLGVNMYDINETYQYGQEVRINLTGLLVGNYGGLMQIGGLYNGNFGRMEENVFKLHAQVNGLAAPAKVEELVITDMTIGDLQGKKSEADLQAYQSRMFRFADTHFEGAGSLTFGDNPGQNGYTNRNLVDAQGNTIVVRTSNRCKFAGQVLPTGSGSVQGILSSFNGTWQLLVMDPATDLVGFDETPTPGPDPDVPSGDNIFAESFKDGIGNFTIENVKAPAELQDIWKHDSKYGYMIATAYNSGTNYEADSWLISPVIDLSAFKEAYLSYDQAINYFSSLDVAKTQAAVAVREEGSTTWTTLTVPSWPSALGWTIVGTGDIDLKAFAGKKIQIGFHYSSTASKAGTWEIKNIVVKPTGTPGPVTPDTPDTPTGDTYLDATFATSMDGFTIENVTMPSELSYVWNLTEQYGMKASAYVNSTDYAAESYLISPVVDLSNATSAKLSFEQALNYFSSLDAAKTEAAVVIREEGASAWTQLTVPSMPASLSWTFAPSGDIDLKAYCGKKVQVAFHYTSTTKAGTWEVKNVTIKK